MPIRVPDAIAAAGPLLARYLVSGGALAAAGAAQLATFAILARALGPAQFGLYVQFTAVASIALQLCDCGSADSLIRRVARDRGLYGAMLGHSLILILAVGALTVALGAPLVQWRFALDPRPGVGIAVAVLLLVSNVVLTRLILLVETIFLALGRIGDANRSVVAFALARTAIAAVSCLLLSATTIERWAICQFCGFVLYGTACLAWLRPLGTPRLALAREEVRPGLLFASQLVARALRQNIDLFVLGSLLPATAIGSYGIARRITDASLISVDAMNRLLYPRFAAASHRRLADALPDARRALAAALLIGLSTAGALLVAASALPHLFGRGYHDLPFFLRALCGLVIPIALWSVAIDLLGASNHQGARASIMNGVNLLGSLVIVAASPLRAPLGTFAALYAIEAATVVVAWAVLMTLTRRSPR